MKHFQSIEASLAFDRAVLELTFEKFKGLSHDLDITRKTYASLMMREILIGSAVKDHVLYPLYPDIEGGTDMAMKTRHDLAGLRKGQPPHHYYRQPFPLDIRGIMLIGAKDLSFDKNVTSIVEKALNLCLEESEKHVPALKAVLDEKHFRDLGSKYEKEKDIVIKKEEIFTEYPMTFDEQIVKDHMIVKKLFEDFKRAVTPEAQHHIAADIIRHISVHSFAEELTIYPLYEKNFQNGKAIADASRNEHNIVKHDSSRAESIKSGDVGFIEIMMKLEKDFFDHGNHEETIEIPTLLSVLTRDEAVKLCERFEKNKGYAPTHPHPSAPDKGGITQKLAGIATAPIDKAKDAMCHH